MSDFEESILSNDEELTFSREQIEYLRDEFERQKRWINLLSTREKSALEELERTQNSISYRFGRFVTWFPRIVQKMIKNRQKSKIVYFVNEEEEESNKDLFPSSLLITPEYLPSDNKSRKSNYLVDEMLIAIKRGKISVNDAKDMFEDGSVSMSDTEQLEAAEKIVGHILSVKEYSPSVNNVFVGILRSLYKRNNDSATTFGDLFLDEIKDDRAIRTLVQAHGKKGNFSRPLELLKLMPKTDWRKEQEKRFNSPHRILNTKLKLKPLKSSSVDSKPKSILYHASQSMPHTSSGYAIRTHGLISALINHNFDVQAVLRFGYPLDRKDFTKQTINEQEEIENVIYHFSHTNRENSSITPYHDVYNFTILEEYLDKATESLIARAKKIQPKIIHSASNFVVGMAGAKAAKALGIPSIYEIRGFWHLTQSTKRKGYQGSDHYNLTERLEIETAKASDHVFTITNALKNILIENGVSSDKISVLPNAVDPTKFNLNPKDKKLEKELEFENKVVIGYVGSFVNYEGLDILLEACSILYKKLGDCFRLLLVGDGAMMQSLRRSVRFLQLEDIVKFTGRVSHDEVQRYYSLIDIAPLPRKGLRVCELVSPLKPFEAMGAGKVLITSSVEALAEIVKDGETGFVFEKDNMQDLADKLELTITNQDLRNEIGLNAHNWVKETHSWEVISQRVIDIYDKLTEEKQ